MELRPIDITILGAGMMGRAIARDLATHSHYEAIRLLDKNPQTLTDARRYLQGTRATTGSIDATDHHAIRRAFNDTDVAISAIPYYHNADLTTIAIETGTHFIDLGGNNDVVAAQRAMNTQAQHQGVTIIPDSGLAPGLVSIITSDIVTTLTTTDRVTIRVGGLPVHPQPPLNYQLVFSPEGLINEYAEPALILDHGTITTKPSLTDLEPIKFPKPFGTMEAFLTSGGSSTLPYTYKDTIHNLDYKTIRYPGHCAIMKALLDLGLTSQTPLTLNTTTITPRDLLITLLKTHIPTEGPDVVLLKVTGTGTKNTTPARLDYTLIDYATTDTSAMMRTTGYPVAITAQLLEQGHITTTGVHTPETIVPYPLMHKELRKRGIRIQRTLRRPTP